MPRRAPRNPQGARGILTPTLSQQIVDLVAEGNYIATAAAACGVSERSIYEWIRKGEEAAQAEANGEPLAPRASRYLQFAQALARARARAEVHAVEVVEQVMTGGFLIEETPVVSREGKLVRDDDGNPLMHRKYAPPDGNLALKYLASAFPTKWRPQTQRLELTGADGGPVQVETSDRAAQLADQLAEHLQRRQQEALESGLDDDEADDRESA